MKIKVSKCSRPTFWYKDKIGEEYSVIRAVTYPNKAGLGFEVKIDGFKKYIDTSDAIIVFEEF